MVNPSKYLYLSILNAFYMISIKDLSMSYDGKVVFENVNWEVGEGEIGLLSGATGSGKTSLLYSIVGFVGKYVEAKVNGKILVNGMKPEEALKKGLIYYVPQEPINSFIGYDVCTELSWKNSDLKLFNEIIKELGLEKILHRDVFTLSGGEAQKVAIGFALLGGYRIVLFDEPLSNLDHESRKKFIEQLKLLREKNVTVIIAEHRTEYLKNITNTTLEFYSEKKRAPEPTINLFKKNVQNKLVKTTNLSYAYEQGNQALKNVNIEINSGEVVSFVGPNGSGKSTMAKLIIGLLSSKGLSVNAKTKGFMLQTPELQFLQDTVVSEVLYESRDKKIADESINFFGLENKRERLPHSLSRGERVRLALASALAKDPELYILDEPTEGQDQYGLSTLVNVLKYIKDFGSSAIIITQEEEFARIISDRVYQFHDGEVYES